MLTRWRAACATSAATVMIACGGSNEPPKVAIVVITPSSPTLLVGQSLQLSAGPRSAQGESLTGRTVTWASLTPSVASVSGAGLVSVTAPGAATITATSEGILGSAQVTVLPVPVARVVVNAPDTSLLVTQSAQFSATTVDSVGGALPGRPITWTSGNPAIASVSSSGLVTGVSAGTTAITAASEGKTTEIPLAITPLPTTGPVLRRVTPSTLVPGQQVAVTGFGFAGTALLNRLTVRGVRVPVDLVTGDLLYFTVPCQGSGPAEIRVANGVGPGTPITAPMATTRRALAVGQSLIVATADSTPCNELAGTGAPSRYLVVVSSAATSQNTTVDFELAGNTPASNAVVPRIASVAARVTSALDVDDARTNDAHFAHLERERVLYQQIRAQLSNEPAPRPRARLAVLPATGDLRTFYYNFTGCNDSTQTFRGKALYIGTRAIIWEDSANTLQSSANADLAAYYQRLGQIFDQDQYDAVRNTWGDPLRRDNLTDNDGRVHMVFTQRLNGSGAAAYVTSCDANARAAGRWGSNFGELFYGNVPTTAGTSLTTTAQPGGWFAFMVRTVVHEVKHISSFAARFANGAPTFEQSWLEEGTARHAEEVWVRAHLHKVAFKSNTGYGTATSNGVFCDFNLANATCLANDALRRPAWGMRRQFNEIKPKLDEPWNWSPYGDAMGQTGSIFYNTTWSLVRYTIDRYAASDAQFFQALNNATTNGITNLSAVAGVPMDRLIGGWGLALFADDYPGLATANPEASFATWNLRSIYGGLNTDPAWSATYPRSFPIVPVPLTFGAFVAQRTGLRGGAHAYFEISGVPAAAQLLDARVVNGAAAALRIAIMRLQ
jgi:hypothetical protein